MTERGLPSADASPACPFVAFEDDRDERADRPDHRHRCFAEEPPAPRAVAHQEAYCLSSAFPVCPVFQQWARREAAHARPESAAPITPPSAAGVAASEWSSAVPPSAPRPAEPAPQRNPPRDWSAPPPWAMGAGAAGRGGPGAADHDGGEDTGFLAGRREGQGLAGSAADRLASSASESTPPPTPTVEPTPPTVPQGAAWTASPGPRSAGADDRSSGPDPDLASLVGPAALSRSAEERLAAARAAERDADQADYAEATGDFPQGRLGRRPSVSSTRQHDRGDRDRQPPPRERVQGDAPSWEKARRSEAFPILKSRGELPGLPRVWALFGALIVAAVALFFLPQLLDVGGEGGTDPTPTPATSPAAATPTPEPTPEPEPTPQVYVIKEGDTLSKVASEFGLTLEELLAANETTIEDPDKISIGDEIIIPARASGEDDGGGGASPTPEP